MLKTVRTLVLFGAPLFVATVNAFHPVHPPHTEIYDTVHPVVVWWITLHVMNIFGFGLLGLAAYLLVLERPGIAGTIARAAFMIFVPAYIGFDAVIGVGTGNLVRYASALPLAQLAMFRPIIQSFWGDGTAVLLAVIGSIAWTFGMGATAWSFATERRGWAAGIAVFASLFTGWGASSAAFGTLPWWLGVVTIVLVSCLFVRPVLPYVLLILAGILFGTTHVVPFGPLGMLCFVAAAAVSRYAGSRATIRSLEPIRS